MTSSRSHIKSQQMTGPEPTMGPPRSSVLWVSVLNVLGVISHSLQPSVPRSWSSISFLPIIGTHGHKQKLLHPLSILLPAKVISCLICSTARGITLK